MREIQISGCTEGKGSTSKPFWIPLGSCLLVSQPCLQPSSAFRSLRVPSGACECFQLLQLPWDQARAGETSALELGVCVTVLGGFGDKWNTGNTTYP